MPAFKRADILPCRTEIIAGEFSDDEGGRSRRFLSPALPARWWLPPQLYKQSGKL